MTEITRKPTKSRLKWVLGGVFLFALLMGPGPGIYLVNGYAAKGGTILGMPALYFWAVLWFLVEAAVVLTAYLTIWKKDSL
jgi:hypothetical protein